MWKKKRRENAALKIKWVYSDLNQIWASVWADVGTPGYDRSAYLSRDWLLGLCHR